MHIVDITDPANPYVVNSINNDNDFALDGPGGVAVYSYDEGTALYAIVIVYDTDAIQIIDITDPIHPSAVFTLWNDASDSNGNSFALDKPWGIQTHKDSDSTYAIVMARMGNTVQMIDITDPFNPFVATTIRNDEGFEIAAPVSFEIYKIDNRAHAIITSLVSNTVQIADITNPLNPSPISTFSNDDGFEIGDPTGVEIYKDSNSNKTYAMITGFTGNTVKIVEVDTGMMTLEASFGNDVLNDSEPQNMTMQDFVVEEKRIEDSGGGNGDGGSDGGSDGGVGGGCLIATAVYGTELAPQIQVLRETRDNVILTTEAGSVFMQGFNHVYYSFSPAIADMQRQNHMLNMAIKTLISPMITTLSIMTLADDSSEYTVVGLGILVVTLNLSMYAGLPILVGFFIRRRRQNVVKR